MYQFHTAQWGSVVFLLLSFDACLHWRQTWFRGSFFAVMVAKNLQKSDVAWCVLLAVERSPACSRRAELLLHRACVTDDVRPSTQRDDFLARVVIYWTLPVSESCCRINMTHESIRSAHTSSEVHVVALIAYRQRVAVDQPSYATPSPVTVWWYLTAAIGVGEGVHLPSAR